MKNRQSKAEEQNKPEVVSYLEQEIVDNRIDPVTLAIFASPRTLKIQAETKTFIKQLLANIETNIKNGELSEKDLNSFLTEREKPYYNYDQPSYTRCLIYAGNVFGIMKEDPDEPLGIIEKGMQVKVNPEGFELIENGTYSPNTTFEVIGFKHQDAKCIRIEPINDEYEEKIFVSPQQIVAK